MKQDICYVAHDHTFACDELRRRNIPFKEVTLTTSNGKQPALTLSPEVLVIIMAGEFLTDN